MLCQLRAVPQAMLLAGGQALGDVDVGYGPARLYAPNELADFSAFVHTLNEHTFLDDVRARDLREHEIYGAQDVEDGMSKMGCRRWDDEDTQALKSLWDYVAALKSYLNLVASRDLRVIIYLY